MATEKDCKTAVFVEREGGREGERGREGGRERERERERDSIQCISHTTAKNTIFIIA